MYSIYITSRAPALCSGIDNESGGGLQRAQGNRGKETIPMFLPIRKD